MYTQSDIDKIKELILSHVTNVEDIILFGSYARGTATQDSDMDFAVLLNTEINRNEKLQLLGDIRWEFAKLGYDIDILIKEKRKFLNEISLPTLSRVIQNEGKLLWTRN